MEVWTKEASGKPGDADKNALLDLCLRNRDVTAPPDYRLANLARPDEFKGLGEAAEVLAQAIALRRRIVVLSDYDADGATGAAVMVEGLRSLGAGNVSYRVPDRLKHGYGLTPQSADLVLQDKPDVIVTVDNGIGSFDGVAHVRRHSPNCQVVITDHHLPHDGPNLPDADAVVNPQQVGCAFPSKNLCGCGVAFYVIAAVRHKLAHEMNLLKNPVDLRPLLDLVALATVADVVPFDQNNRILVAGGLNRINAGVCRPGITALLQLAKRKLGSTVAEDLAFAVGPRINAAGRLSAMSLGIECLLTWDHEKAVRLASELDQTNRRRRETEAGMVADANAQVVDESAPASCLYDPNWHEGVVGIVASRIKERTRRPVICFARSSQHPKRLKGSARSVPGCHMKHALDAINKERPGLLKGYGGHAMAAGLEIDEKRLDELREAMSKKAEEALKEVVMDDGVVADAAHLPPDAFTLDNAAALVRGGPWGQEFPPPRFAGTFDVADQRILDGGHVKFRLRPQGAPEPIDAIAFNVSRRGETVRPFGESVHCHFALDVNEFRGRRSLQLVVGRVEDATAATMTVRPISERGAKRPASPKRTNRTKRSTATTGP